MGGHQYRLHNGMPAVNQPGGISAIKSSDLDNVPIVPGCTLLLRIMPHTQVRPNKEISVFLVTGLKILGRVGTHIFFNSFFFLEKNIFLCILKGEMPFKMHEIIYFFPENQKKILGFNSK